MVQPAYKNVQGEMDGTVGLGPKLQNLSKPSF